MQVLIADGDEAFLDEARIYLSRSGHEVETASNGLECVEILRRYVPAVVVLARELLWGGGDGVRAVMQQDPEWSEIPVILTSENVLPEESRFARPPLAARLQKPCRLEDLLGQLQVCGPDKYEKSCFE